MPHKAGDFCNCYFILNIENINFIRLTRFWKMFIFQNIFRIIHSFLVALAFFWGGCSNPLKAKIYKSLYCIGFQKIQFCL